MTVLLIDEQSIAYEVAGDAGPPVLLLHGTTMDHTAFDGVRAAMPAEAQYQFVMMDLPGSGDSTVPDQPLTVENISRHAHALMLELGHPRYHVVGFSIGAVVAAALSAAQPREVRSATLIAGWIAADARMKATFELWRRLLAVDPELFTRYALADGFTAAAHELMAPMLEPIVAKSATTVAPGSAAHIDLDIAANISELVGQIAAPTLIIGGAEDRWVDVAHSHALGRAIAGSRVEVLAAGHMMIAEQPAHVAALLHPHLAAH
jgi:pimeloyl-ACP methyl ester carboxylesterase